MKGCQNAIGQNEEDTALNIIESIDGLSMGAIVPDSVINADCLEAMKLLPDNSIDLILSDPPYLKVKKKEEWDPS